MCGNIPTKREKAADFSEELCRDSQQAALGISTSGVCDALNRDSIGETHVKNGNKYRSALFIDPTSELY